MRCMSRFAFVILIVTSGMLDAQDPPRRRYSLGGLGDLVTQITGGLSRAITAVAPAGDVDGDGREDLLIRAADPLSVQGDRVHLLFGFEPPGGELDLDDPRLRRVVIRTASSPATIDLEHRGSSALAGGSDVNGDGKPDLLVASGFEASVQSAAVLVIYGGALPEEFDGQKIGQEIQGAFIVDPNQRFTERIGQFATLADDLNGDGLAEIVLVDPGYSTPTHPNNSGTAFVIFGSRGLPARIDVDAIGSGEVPGFIVAGPPSAILQSACGLGDADGDGLGDLGLSLIPLTGERVSYLLFGSRQFPTALAAGDIPNGRGVRIAGAEFVTAAGDIDGDRLEDVLADMAPPGGGEGLACVIYGRGRAAWSDTVDVGDIEHGGFGTVIEDTYDRSGAFGTPNPNFALARGSDVDGDGRPDVLAAVTNGKSLYGPAAALRAGVAYLIASNGKPPGRLPARLTTEEVAADRGIRLDGIDPEQQAGREAFLLENFGGGGTGSILLASSFDHCMAPYNREFKLWLVSAKVLEAVRERPAIGTILPAQGSLDGRNEVLLLGRGFGAEPQISFGPRVAAIREVIGDGIAVVEAPAAGFAGRLPVQVRTEIGASLEDISYRTTPQRTNEVGPGKATTLAIRHDAPEEFGSRGALAGDYDGDGSPDVALAEYRKGTPVVDLWFLFGDGKRSAGWSLDSPLPVRSSVLRIDGEQEALTVIRLASDGDAGADGFDDLLLQMTSREAGVGDEWWLLLGRKELPQEDALKEQPGIVRFFHGSETILAGAGAIVPDVTGDGIGDVLLSYWVNASGRTSLHILKGQKEWPAEGVRLEDAAGLGLGAHLIVDLNLFGSAGFAGDFNRDGRRDVFFGGDGSVGEGAMAILYNDPLIFSGRTITVNRGFFGDVAGLLIAGPSWFSGNQFAAAFPGDLMGDDLDELFFRQDNRMGCSLAPFGGEGVVVDYLSLIGAGIPESRRLEVQAMYAGRNTGMPDFVPGEPGSQGGVLRLRSELAGEGFAGPAAPAGDFDGDGLPDLLLGAPGVDGIGPSSGSCYVIRGGTLGNAGPLLSMSDLGERGIRLSGKGIHRFGKFLDSRFDWDRDGFDDILIGADGGEAYVVYGGPEKEIAFIRGDSNMDSLIDLTDPVYTLGFLFLGGIIPSCMDASDVDDDGEVSITDAVFSLNFQFLGGLRPPAPFPGAGPDPTGDDPLRCRG